MNYKSAITPIKHICKQLKQFFIGQFNCNNVKTFHKGQIIGYQLIKTVTDVFP